LTDLQKLGTLFIVAPDSGAVRRISADSTISGGPVFGEQVIGPPQIAGDAKEINRMIRPDPYGNGIVRQQFSCMLIIFHECNLLEFWCVPMVLIKSGFCFQSGRSAAGSEFPWVSV
jgi:hypothetical protein